MNKQRNRINEICIIDSSKILTKEGFTNLCQKYGSIRNITIHKKEQENRAFIEFEDKNAINQLLKVESDLPSFLKILTFDKTNCEDIKKCEDFDTSEVNESLEKVSNEVTHNEQIISRESIYYGPNISGNSLIEESKQFKLNNNVKVYNLENDELFGRPLCTKWDNIEISRPKFEVHNLEFNQRFINCTGGEIKLEKKLSPNTFTGWTTTFNNGENVQDKLKSISTDIELSDHLNIKDVKKGMFVGAFDCSTNLYCRGYVVLVSGNSVNVALSDYGRVINTIKVRVLPEKYTQISAYSFKVFTKGNDVLQFKEKPYVFKLCSVSIERIVLIIFDENTSIKVQLKKWQPSVEESGVPYIDFKNGSSVELLKLKDMNSVCLRSKEKHHLDTFFSIWNTVAVYCFKNPQPLNRMPLYGEIIGFKSTLCNNYVRARIHKYLGNDLYSVKHMDNPFKENIKSSEIIELPYEQKSIPVSFLKVGLKGALPYPIQFEAKKCVDFIIGVPLSVHFDESIVEGWRYVDLNVKVVKENLNAILFGLAEPMWLKDKPTDIVEESNLYCKYSDLLMYELKEKLVINMKFVMYHEGIFYMRDKAFGKSFSLLSSMIKEYCSLSLNPYLPHCNEICLGQFPDGMWYRVLTGILKPGELTKVYSVDLGNVAYLTSTNMKKLPPELRFHPAHVYLCMLDIAVPVDAKKLKLLQKYENTDCELTIVKNLGGKNLDFDVYNYDYLIKCPFLEDILN